MRYVGQKKDIVTALLIAKSRVAPLQTVTLPRLELRTFSGAENVDYFFNAHERELGRGHREENEDQRQRLPGTLWQ